MSTLLAELSTRASHVSPEERARLAEGLLESLRKAPPSEVKAAWDAEILKRVSEYERGEAVLTRGADVFAEAHCLTQ